MDYSLEEARRNDERIERELKNRVTLDRFDERTEQMLKFLERIERRLDRQSGALITFSVMLAAGFVLFLVTQLIPQVLR